MNLKNFWYVAAESHELRADKPLHVEIMSEWIVLYRDSEGRPVALQDKCLHRNVQLSNGTVKDGQLTCPYHGWTYDGKGEVVKIPSETTKIGKRCAVSYKCKEHQKYIYICLESSEQQSLEPFEMPSYKAPGYVSIRLQNTFENTVVNCAENFVDIPHTTYVHPTIFRNPGNQEMEYEVTRDQGSVFVEYLNEKSDFGIFSWFLAPKGTEIKHTDAYYMPNVTSVHYWFGKSKHFIITSQSVPVTDSRTKVYTDLTYNYGVWSKISKPIVKAQGQAIINQDITILNNQAKTIKKYGTNFQNSPCDTIHMYIESIYKELEEGRDPKDLPTKKKRVQFWI